MQFVIQEFIKELILLGKAPFTPDLHLYLLKGLTENLKILKHVLYQIIPYSNLNKLS